MPLRVKYRMSWSNRSGRGFYRQFFPLKQNVPLPPAATKNLEISFLRGKCLAPCAGALRGKQLDSQPYVGTIIEGEGNLFVVDAAVVHSREGSTRLARGPSGREESERAVKSQKCRDEESSESELSDLFSRHSCI
jgi:hypothetical protein